MVMASCVAVLFGDKIRSQSKPFLYLFQLVAAKDPVHVPRLTESTCASVGSNGACDQCTAIAISVNPVGNCGD